MISNVIAVNTLEGRSNFWLMGKYRHKLGFKQATTTCCGVGRVEGDRWRMVKLAKEVYTWTIQ